MSYPGIIERSLDADEFSIYLDNSKPIPLSALATFLRKIDKSARSVKGMEGGYLQLSDFALGSNELRFKVVGQGRQARDENNRQDRMAAAAEKSAKASVVAAGAAVVAAIATVVAAAISTGDANPSTYRITNEYNVQTIYVRAPNEPAHIITKRDIENGRIVRLSGDRSSKAVLIESEHRSLLNALDRNEVVNLAGRFRRQRSGAYEFETMRGNKLPAHFKTARHYENTPVAINAIVQDSGAGLVLDVVDVIAELNDL
jgi:hypothetical protein